MSMVEANRKFAEHVQRSLHALGLYTGAIDGWAGVRTTEAFNALLKLVGRPVQDVDLSIWDERSRRCLEGVHADLVRLMTTARRELGPVFVVIEGLRTRERQETLVRQGASKTMNSRHLTGHAVDIAPLDDRGQPSFSWTLYHKLAPQIKDIAARIGVPVVWGGDWKSFPDGPHFELPRDRYP